MPFYRMRYRLPRYLVSTLTNRWSLSTPAPASTVALVFLSGPVQAIYFEHDLPKDQARWLGINLERSARIAGDHTAAAASADGEGKTNGARLLTCIRAH